MPLLARPRNRGPTKPTQFSLSITTPKHPAESRSAVASMGFWRQTRADDIADIVRIAAEVHSELQEDEHVFEERVKLYPQGCFILLIDGQAVGYAISHPIVRGFPPALNSPLGEIPPSANQYYIHDLAILPAARGKGHSTEIIQNLLIVSKEFRSVGLISVYGTGPFWRRFGFVSVPVEEEIRMKLRKYGDDAVFLERDGDDEV